MSSLPIAYQDYQQILLDIKVYNRIKSAPYQSLKSMKEMFFEEFKRSRPYPKLEDERYKISQQVSSNYKILYDKEVELELQEMRIY